MRATIITGLGFSGHPRILEITLPKAEETTMLKNIFDFCQQDEDNGSFIFGIGQGIQIIRWQEGPSLSVGDLIILSDEDEWGSKTFQVANLGFRRIDTSAF